MTDGATPNIPENVIAFALDTNSLASGRADFSALERFVDSIVEQDLDDVEVWIPEPVVWEWAEHAWRQYNVTSSLLKKLMKELDGARIEASLSPPEELKTIEDAVAHIEDALTDIWAVSVLRLSDHPQASALGLRDQVLGLGAGRRKSAGQSEGIKTGAADSTSYRLVEAVAGKDIEKVVLVTGDRDAWSHFSQAASHARPRIVRSLWEAQRGVLRIPSNEQYANEVRAAIVRSFAVEGLVTFDRASSENFSNPFDDDPYADSQVLSSSMTITAIGGLIGVSDLEVSRAEQFASAVVVAHVDYMTEGVRWDAIDDELIHVWDERHDVPVEAQVSAHRRDDGEWNVEVDHIVGRRDSD